MYWIGKVNNQIAQNHKAWAQHIEGNIESYEEAEKRANELFHADWSTVPNGCVLGYDYLVFRESA